MISTYVECDAIGCDTRAVIHPMSREFPRGWIAVMLPTLDEWYEAPRSRHFCSAQCVLAYEADLLTVEREATARIAAEQERVTVADVSPEDAADQEQADRDLDHLDGL